MRKALKHMVADYKSKHNVSERFIMERISGPHHTGGDIYRNIVGDRGAPGTSEYLNSLGIKGIKYLDQQSRGEGEGTRNLVVFDETLPKITKINGEPVTAEEEQQIREDMVRQRAEPAKQDVASQYDGRQVTYQVQDEDGVRYSVTDDAGKALRELDARAAAVEDVRVRCL